MTPIAAANLESSTPPARNVASSTPARALEPGSFDRDHAPSAPASSGPTVLVASLALHALAALALVSLPMPTGLARDLEETWVDFELTTPPAAAVTPEPEVVPPEPVAPPPLPDRIVRRERPQQVAAPEPPPPAETLAPPSIDEVFGEPPPPAAVMTREGAGAFAVAPGELGGVPGGVAGGHGTSLVSAVRPAPTQEPSTADADRRRARRSYVHAVEELVRAHTRYPRAASREGLQGRVELALRIGNDGHVLAIRVASTSGHGILDDAALDAAREIDRVPAPPLVAALSAADEVRVGVVYLVR